MKCSELKKLILLCKEYNLKYIKIDGIEIAFNEPFKPLPQIAESQQVSPKRKALELVLQSSGISDSELKELEEKF